MFCIIVINSKTTFKIPFSFNYTSFFIPYSKAIDIEIVHSVILIDAFSE